MYTQWSDLSAMTVMTGRPITLLFGFLRRYITTGIATTSIE